MSSIDEKWKMFILNDNIKNVSDEKKINNITNNNNIITDISTDIDTDNSTDNNKIDKTKLKFEINISTKTKTLFFNKSINIYDIFWNIPIINFSTLNEGVIKKEIKIVNNTKEETLIFEEKLKKNNSPYFIDQIIKSIDNTDARGVKYKNQHKLIIGINKKDIIKKTTKLFNPNKLIKGAFRNCLVIIIRLFDGNQFKETHVKIFNTGIIKIPGILNNESFNKIKETIYNIINVYEFKDNIPLSIVEEDFRKDDLEKNVLINSNFKCGFNIYLNKLYNILRSSKYNIEVSIDTTTYPALRCKYYFHTDTGYDIDKQTGIIKNDDLSMKWKDLNKSGKYKKISIMIFRTGNGLIMGKISEKLLMFIFEKIKNIIFNEYEIILNPSPFIDKINIKKKNKSVKINITNNYFNNIINPVHSIH
jgi:hypothetical protein